VHNDLFTVDICLTSSLRETDELGDHYYVYIKMCSYLLDLIH